MGRNAHPEETVEKILDVAMRLFVEHGYDQTSMQDIIDGLGGLTKGAVYHHFKSKEELLSAGMARLMRPSLERMRAIRDAVDYTGLQKLQMLLDEGGRGIDTAFFGEAKPELDPMVNPRMLAMEYHEALEVSARDFVVPVIEQGVRDGSIATRFPKELGEAVCLLLNTWCTPGFYPAVDANEQRRRVAFMQDLLYGMGADVQLDPSRDVETLERRRAFDGAATC